MTDPTDANSPRTVWAEPYTARRCPACETWVYVAGGPFAEGDPTKTVADWLHWQRLHLDDGDTATTIGFPYFYFNETAVEASLEAAAADRLGGVRRSLIETLKVIQDINDRLDRRDRQQHRADPEPPGIPD